MKMKKTIAITAIIAGVGIASMSYAAGGWGKRGANYYNCPMAQNTQVSQVDPAMQEKRSQFFNETVEIRKEIAMKQAEKRALLSNDNPDPAAVSKLTGELFDLRTSLRTKAEEAGLPPMIGPMAGRGDRGFGMQGRGFGSGPDNDYGQGPRRNGKGGRGQGFMNNQGYMQNRL